MEKQKSLAGLNRNIFNLGLTSLLTDISTEMIIPLLPLFLVNVLGAPLAFVGIIEGIAESAASILKVVSGWLSDKLKKRKLLVVAGYSLSAAVKPLLALAVFPWQVLVLRFFERTGKGIRTSPRDAMIADSTRPAEIGKFFGFHRAMDTSGAILGPLLAFGLLPLFQHNYRLVFLLAAIPAILAVLVLGLFVKESKAANLMPEQAGVEAALDKRFIWFVIVFILFTLGNSSDAFIVLRAQNLEVAVFLIPIFWLVMNISYALSAVPAGLLADKIGRKRLLILGFLIYSLVYFGFAFAKQSWQAWLLMIVYGIYYGISDGGARAYIADLTRRESRATAYGLFHAAVGLAALPASILMGIFWQTLGISFAFSFGAVLALGAALLLIFLVK